MRHEHTTNNHIFTTHEIINNLMFIFFQEMEANIILDNELAYVKYSAFS